MAFGQLLERLKQAAESSAVRKYDPEARNTLDYLLAIIVVASTFLFVLGSIALGMSQQILPGHWQPKQCMHLQSHTMFWHLPLHNDILRYTYCKSQLA